MLFFPACAYKFVEAGAKVILSARNVNRLNYIKDDIVKKYGNVSIHIYRYVLTSNISRNDT